MNLPSPRRCRSKAPFSNHPFGFTHELRCQPSHLAITLNAKPVYLAVASLHPLPSPMFSTLPVPLAVITRAARPRKQRHYADARPLPPHNASRAWGCASRPSSLLFVPRTRWLPVACLSLAKPAGPPLATHKPWLAPGHALKDNVKRGLVCVVLVVLGWASGGGIEGARRGA
jgi:hypothetical protein